MFGKLIVALTIATSAVMALPTRRADGFASCNYLFVPGVPVVPATTNLVADFNYITGRALAVAVSPHIINGPGSTFTENADNTFNVSNKLETDVWTCAQTAAFLESLAGTNQLGPDGVTWLIKTSECTCDD
ncbi:hypothetical protein NP233_g3274 [Leucocoprinus birnbaumii]|uniref:Uncharacterized protein n=1 Tax=Leucocoprinus birnbaumii TaxID=56174 RepID=A0AAD5YY32_9AGAR|nr:hypothetical protein NP233_g3274 [Leucocoprinus birnbaumii]